MPTPACGLLFIFIPLPSLVWKELCRVKLQNSFATRTQVQKVITSFSYWDQLFNPWELSSPGSSMSDRERADPAAPRACPAWIYTTKTLTNKKTKTAEGWCGGFGKAAGLQVILAFSLRTFLMVIVFRNCEVICHLQRTGLSWVLLRLS